MDLTEYRASPSEQQRTADLLRLMPAQGHSALDIGARDGYFSRLMADRFEEVTALDLTYPNIQHPRVRCIQGNAVSMQFADRAFDLVFCAEVLEHIPTAILEQACQEMVRVSNRHILIGVPYKQDTRVGRTTCYSCGKHNPPWGHVNTFDERRIAKLFPSCTLESISFIGSTTERTNWLSAVLMNFAGNPYGTYQQEETCVYCNRRLIAPPRRNTVQRIATRCAFELRKISEELAEPRGNWMHLILRKI